MEPIRASVVFLTYNQEAFVKEALQSLLDQDYDNLEIVVSDDCSKDGTWEVVEELTKTYSGGKKIVLNRNLTNLGLVANYTKAFQLTSGDLIFTAAGDDISLPSRCAVCINYWGTLDTKPDLVAADGFDMTLDGHDLGVKETDELGDWNITLWGEKRPFIFGASHMMSRRLIEFNQLNPNLMYEDQCFLFRALLMNGAVRIAHPLVRHRRGGVSQQSKNYNYEAKRKKMIDSARDGILECHQMMNDALLFGLKKQDTLQLLDKKALLGNFICEMLSESSVYEKFKLMAKSTDLPFFKRFRYFHFSTFSWLQYLVMLIKRSLLTRKK
jgi:glycosyltransferase involved in cell wall biosynthesis